jgi:hypothetical protein
MGLDLLDAPTAMASDVHELEVVPDASDQAVLERAHK